MPEAAKKTRSNEPDRLVKGVLTKVGDIFDRLTGRRWQPSSSLATSGLIERVKLLLDSEVRDIPGKGKVVPHRITLKMQWDKFATDNDKGLTALEDELTIATVDHINDLLYYTYAPISVTVKPDYFTEGVRLLSSFEDVNAADEGDAELNVTVPHTNIAHLIPEAEQTAEPAKPRSGSLTATFTVAAVEKDLATDFPADGRISVGRTKESRLQIDDPSVSKHHAVIAIDADGSLTLADTGSTNGTYLNGERIAYGKATAITESDKLVFGTIEVKIQLKLEGSLMPVPVEEETQNEPAETAALTSSAVVLEPIAQPSPKEPPTDTGEATEQ